MKVPETTHTDQLIRKIGQWIETISTPEFRNFKRQQLSYTIADNLERKFIEKEHPDEFVFSGAVEKQHAFVISFYDLISSVNALAQCEYYFRRFPFRGLPISKESHIRNICGLYFTNFYIIKNKIWIVSRQLRKACPYTVGDVKALLKDYDKEFEQELDWRHKVTHQFSFDDINIDRIMLTGMMSSVEDRKGKGWEHAHLRAYRTASKEWSDRVKRRCVDVEKFVDTVAKWILDNALFL